MKPFYILICLTLGISCSYAQQMTWGILNKTDIKPKGTYDSYVSKNGTFYAAGNRVKIGSPSNGKNFTFIQQVSAFGSIQPLEGTMAGSETEITNFRVGGNGRMGYKIWAKTKGVIAVYYYTIDFENAIESGEIKSEGSKSDQALAQLKRAKEKLDLGLITQAEYDELKESLREEIK